MSNTTTLHRPIETNDHIVIGLLPDMESVRKAPEALQAQGTSDEQIGLAMPQIPYWPLLEPRPTGTLYNLGLATQTLGGKWMTRQLSDTSRVTTSYAAARIRS